VTFVWSMLAALALTLTVELAVAAALGLRTRPELLAVACVSLITNPLLNVVLTLVWSWGPVAYFSTLAVLEALVVVAEWRMLLWALRGDSRRLLLVATVMNGASLLLGFLLWLI
jgi:hypothetical protein